MDADGGRALEAARAAIDEIDRDRDGKVSLGEWREYVAAQYRTRAERAALFAIVQGHVAQAEARKAAAARQMRETVAAQEQDEDFEETFVNPVGAHGDIMT